MLDSDLEKLDQLMKLSQKGDRQAFAELCELRRKGLVAEVKRKIDPRLQVRVDASDVIQEVFWDANRRLDEVIDNGVPLLAWVRFLCNQKLVDLYRKHHVSQKRSLNREIQQFQNATNHGSLANHFVANMTSPSMRVQRAEVVEQVKAMLQVLSPIDREILVLRHFHSMTNQEVAETIGLSVNAASNRYIRALKRFKKIFDSLES